MQRDRHRSSTSTRYRVVKACDHCRRLKIKCDGSSPCNHCQVYERNCTYDTPSRRPKSLAQRARELESRLQTVQRLLKAISPDLDIDDPQVNDKASLSELQSILHPKSNSISGISKSLPSKDVTYALLPHCFEDACALHRFIHEPSFYMMVELIYETPCDRLEQTYSRFLALLFASLALGSHFANGLTGHSLPNTAVADLTQGFHYLDLTLSLLNTIECHDLTSLQSLCLVAIFLQSSGHLERCYSYVGLALRTAVALGLHRSQKNPPNMVTYETQKRVFWTIWRLDIYSSSMLGIPSLLSANDIDQDYPQSVNDDYTTQDPGSAVHPDQLMTTNSINLHINLTALMPAVMRHRQVFKSAKPTSSVDLQNLMRRSDMFAIEAELQAWSTYFPSELTPGCQACGQPERLRKLLRVAYAYVQMVLYEPLLGWIKPKTDQVVEPEVFHYLVQYITVARNIVSAGVSIYKTNLANYSSRSTMISTTYSAIMSLVLFLLKIPAPSGTKGAVLAEAFEGREVLEGIAPKSKLANEYLQKLNHIMSHFQNMPHPGNHLFAGSSSYPSDIRNEGRSWASYSSQSKTGHTGHVPSTLQDDRVSFSQYRTASRPQTEALLTPTRNVHQLSSTTLSPWYMQFENFDTMLINSPDDIATTLCPPHLTPLIYPNETLPGSASDLANLWTGSESPAGCSLNC